MKKSLFLFICLINGQAFSRNYLKEMLNSIKACHEFLSGDHTKLEEALNGLKILEEVEDFKAKQKVLSMPFKRTYNAVKKASIKYKELYEEVVRSVNYQEEENFLNSVIEKIKNLEANELSLQEFQEKMLNPYWEIFLQLVECDEKYIDNECDETKYWYWVSFLELIKLDKKNKELSLNDSELVFFKHLYESLMKNTFQEDSKKLLNQFSYIMNSVKR